MAKKKEKKKKEPTLPDPVLRNRHLEDVLTRLRSIRQAHSFPVRTRVALIHMIRSVAGVYGAVLEVQEELVEEHGEEDKDGKKVVRRDSDAWPTFEEDWNELMNAPVEADIEPFEMDGMADMEFDEEIDLLLELGLFKL